MGLTQIQHRDGQPCMIGTNTMQIWGWPAKCKAGNTPCSLQPKTEPGSGSGSNSNSRASGMAGHWKSRMAGAERTETQYADTRA